MTENERIIELMSARLDGELDKNGEAELDRILASSEEYRHLFAAMTGAHEALSQSAEPPAKLLTGVMSAVKREQAQKRARRRGYIGIATGLAAAAALAVVFIPGGFTSPVKNGDFASEPAQYSMEPRDARPYENDTVGSSAPTEPSDSEQTPQEPAKPQEPAAPEEPNRPTAPDEPAQPPVTVPTDPAPEGPAPTDPTPTDPVPMDPAPTDPMPTDPEPTDPEPSEPTAPGEVDPADPTAPIRPSEPTVPVMPAEPADTELVNVAEYIPGIYVELKYATEDNFTGQVIYDFTEARLRYGTVKKLAAVQAELEDLGLSLKIWDAYRPEWAQYKLWEACPDSRFVADPYRGGSKHSRGNTVDITIVTAQGEDVETPTGFDNFTPKADRDYSDVTELAAANAELLEKLMTENGFKPYSAEWWHYVDTVSYDIV